MEKCKRMIVLPHGERTRLAEEFNTTYRTVCSALNYITDSPKAKMLRKAALERGGYEFVKYQKADI